MNNGLIAGFNRARDHRQQFTNRVYTVSKLKFIPIVLEKRDRALAAVRRGARNRHVGGCGKQLLTSAGAQHLNGKQANHADGTRD